MIKGIQNAVTMPVMAKCRIGHFAEAQILEAIAIDYIDESEVLSPAAVSYTHLDVYKRQAIHIEISAAYRPPMCIKPVGLGANLVTAAWSGSVRAGYFANISSGVVLISPNRSSAK